MRWLAVFLIPAVAAACASRQAASSRVVAELVDEEKRSVGQAVFTQDGDGVRIELALHGLPPGSHGVHIHEGGECAAPGFESAGGHFNPFEKEHGLSNPKGPHAGDLPNIQVGANGAYHGTLSARFVTLGPGRHSLLKPGGTSIVIHANPDDHRSQPAGNSGARIACGSIGNGAP